MPCDQIRTVTLELKNADLDLLKSAIEELGYRVRQVGNRLVWAEHSYNKDTGELNVRNNAMGARIKGLYADKLVDRQVQQLSRFGTRWGVKKNVQKDGVIQYRLYEK